MTGRALAGLGGLALIVSLFAPWFDSGVAILTTGANGTERLDVLGPWVSGWEAFAVVDVLLTVMGVLAIAIALTRRNAAVGAAVGWIAVALIAYELLTVDGGIRYGAWIGLVASIVAWAGSWLSMERQR